MRTTVRPYDPDAKQPIVWRGWLLYLLPLPLLPATFIALAGGSIGSALVRAAGFALIVGAASCIRKGIKIDNEAVRRNLRRRASTVRYRFVGAIMASAGTFLVAWLGTDGSHGLISAVLFALAVLGGCYLYYDFDDPDRMPGVSAVGITNEELIELLDEAEGRIQRIEADARRINNNEFRDRLRRIAVEAREILRTIEQDPVDARRARKFLKVYLDGAQQVTEGYARAHRGEKDPALEDNFRRVLGTIETVIGEQQKKLAENNSTDLDVKIEVLQMQLEQEGVV
jgi:5-bromo-4-chloroindolyl phosphate hydrolysis protein